MAEELNKECAEEGSPVSLQEFVFNSESPLTPEELATHRGDANGGCPAHQLPVNASKKERIDACASCSEGCSDREIEFVGSPKKLIGSAIAAFVVVAIICIVLQQVL